MRYLSPELDLSKMYGLYLKKYEPLLCEQQEKGEKCKPIVSYDFYCHHFNSNYKMFFGAPRSDTCQTCDRLENLLKSERNQDVKQKILHKKEIHLRKSEEFYKDLKSRQIEAKANDEVEVISFDFQQICHFQLFQVEMYFINVNFGLITLLYVQLRQENLTVTCMMKPQERRGKMKLYVF